MWSTPTWSARTAADSSPCFSRCWRGGPGSGWCTGICRWCGEHPFAYSAALALEAAAQQGPFWELHDRLLSEPAHLGRTGLAKHATQLGLNPAELLRPASEQHDPKVREDFQSGIDSGLQGTPGIFVNRFRLLRIPSLRQLLDAVDRAAAP